MDLSSTLLLSPRLRLRPFAPEDAEEAWAVSTPSLTRFMTWDPAPSVAAFAEIWQRWQPMAKLGTDVHFAIRLVDNGEFVGIVALHNMTVAEPETGIWIKESMHGNGLGREAVAAVVAFAGNLEKAGLIYPVVEQNRASRHLVECLGGKIIGRRVLRKVNGPEYPEVIYRIPLTQESNR